MSHSIRRSILTLVLCLTLGSSAASANPLSWSDLLGEDGLRVARFLDGLARAIEGPRPRKLGCSIDPNGKPRCEPVAVPKAGCEINPNGHTVCTP